MPEYARNTIHNEFFGSNWNDHTLTGCRTMTEFSISNIWTASSEFGTYRLCEQQRFRRDCASAQSRQNLRCSLIQAVNQEEPSDRKPDSWPLWMAGHAQLKFVMTECSKTQNRLTRLIWSLCSAVSNIVRTPDLCLMRIKSRSACKICKDKKQQWNIRWVFYDN